MQTVSSNDSTDDDVEISAAKAKEEVLATGDETKRILVRVERVGRVCPGQSPADAWQVPSWTPCSLSNLQFFCSCF